MPRSTLLSKLARSIRIARFCEREGLSTRDGLARVEEQEAAARAARVGRRGFLVGAGATGAALAAASLMPSSALARASGARIAIIGGGIGGLVCADACRAGGLHNVVVYDSNSRVGGRIWTRSIGHRQVAESGGEMIDNLHKVMLGYANGFGCRLEDYEKAPGEVLYYYGGRHYSEAEVVDQWRIAEQRMQPDLHSLSYPTFYYHTEEDVRLDNTDLATYLDLRCGDLPLIRGVLETAYDIEYGRRVDEQSCLNMLLFIHLDRRSKFMPFGVYSDERYHLVDGNAQIVEGLRDSLENPVQTGAQLTRLGKNAAGEYLMYFNGSTTPEVADAVVLAMSFAVLRRVQLDANLGLSADKLRAIRDLGYGHNAKLSVAFGSRPWAERGGNGTIYANLPYLQNTWETNAANAGRSAVLTAYPGADLALALARGTPANPYGCGTCHTSGGMSDSATQADADRFLSDLDRVVPGAKAAALKQDGKYVLQFGHWLTNPHSRCSYTCYTPGQFTTIEGLTGESAGRIKFVGEHADSFYSWQGFMEGAALSGQAAAKELVTDFARGTP